uniref:ribonuclease H n=1 Tax=Dicentrarchus labrax TaxID=13489 RepID=E6ZFN2_DICLA|nr:Uncharacterized protein [Dicentrarchus labrax]
MSPCPQTLAFVPPLRHGLYRIPEARRQAVEEEVKKMLQLGVIEPSHSPWSNPIVLVPKPDESWRFCNDFRQLNKASKFDSYPLPRVDELVERLGRARFISTLDLTKGHWQVSLSPDSKQKTAFSTPSGHWQYRVLPFGVHGAPTTFQRMMDQILAPHQDYAAAYLDDVVIHAEDWSEHNTRLRKVLAAIHQAGLTANPSKCHLGLAEACYLGYLIGRGLIKPQEAKVTAVKEFPSPTTKRQVRVFLGLAGYYRRFIPSFSSTAAVLSDLTKKGQPEKICWSPAEEAAFVRLKEALTSEPVLWAPDFSKPFWLCTDASDVGLGMVLSQEKYAAVEREALAVKWAILELRYYLLG